MKVDENLSKALLVLRYSLNVNTLDSPLMFLFWAQQFFSKTLIDKGLTTRRMTRGTSAERNSHTVRLVRYSLTSASMFPS
jgi:hypothetical protein